MKIIIERKLLEETLDQLKASQKDCYVRSTQNCIDDIEITLKNPNNEIHD